MKLIVWEIDGNIDCSSVAVVVLRYLFVMLIALFVRCRIGIVLNECRIVFEWSFRWHKLFSG